VLPFGILYIERVSFSATILKLPSLARSTHKQTSFQTHIPGSNTSYSTPLDKKPPLQNYNWNTPSTQGYNTPSSNTWNTPPSQNSNNTPPPPQQQSWSQQKSSWGEDSNKRPLQNVSNNINNNVPNYQPQPQPQGEYQPRPHVQVQPQFASPLFFDPSKVYMNPYGNGSGFGGYQQLDMNHGYMNMYNQMQAFCGLNSLFSQLTGQSLPQPQPQEAQETQEKQEQSSTSTVDAKSSTTSK